MAAPLNGSICTFMPLVVPTPDFLTDEHLREQDSKKKLSSHVSQPENAYGFLVSENKAVFCPTTISAGSSQSPGSHDGNISSKIVWNPSESLLGTRCTPFLCRQHLNQDFHLYQYQTRRNLHINLCHKIILNFALFFLLQEEKISQPHGRCRELLKKVARVRPQNFTLSCRKRISIKLDCLTLSEWQWIR